jgi:hypothetical protein
VKVSHEYGVLMSNIKPNTKDLSNFGSQLSVCHRITLITRIIIVNTKNHHFSRNLQLN